MGANGIICEISLLRLWKVKDVKLCEIEPYSYERSSKNANCHETRTMIQEGKGNKNKIIIAGSSHRRLKRGLST